MLDDTKVKQSTTGAPIGNIVPGEPVYDVNGDKVGTVSEHDGQSTYFTAQRGIIFTHDLYVPMSAVTRADADGVYLNLAKDDISNQDWDNPPTAGVNTGTPYTNTGKTAAYGQGLDAAMRNSGTRGIGPQNEGIQQDTGNWTQTGDANVPVREEELLAQKERGEAGRARLHKDVVEQQQTMNVPVSHEELQVERVPVDDQQAAGDIGPDAFTDKDIDVPLMGEQVNVEKQVRVGEEVRLRRQDVTQQQQVSGTVRKEQVRVDGADEQDVSVYDTPDQPTIADSQQP
jgi:uncharacterized protein (TIGR02271 family)